MNNTLNSTAEAQLVEWAEINEDRDNRVLRAVAAGIDLQRIHSITGISRTTINHILDGSTATTPRFTVHESYSAGAGKWIYQTRFDGEFPPAIDAFDLATYSGYSEAAARRAARQGNAVVATTSEALPTFDAEQSEWVW